MMQDTGAECQVEAGVGIVERFALERPQFDLHSVGFRQARRDRQVRLGHVEGTHLRPAPGQHDRRVTLAAPAIKHALAGNITQQLEGMVV